MATVAASAPAKGSAGVTSPVAAAAGGSTGRGGEQALELSHAYLDVFEPSLDGALDKPGSPLGQIKFQFNPKELTLGKSASWAREKAKGTGKAGPPQYTGPMPSKLSLEMFFDASGKRDDAVVQRVKELFACCVPTEASLKKKKPSPPWVMFRWGKHTEFHAYVSSVQVKYTLFTAAGLPVRATCTVTLEEISGAPPKQNPSSGGLVPRRAHVLVEGDTLAGIAYREYGDPSLWRAVAVANGIDDPMHLRPGSSVLLPAVDELAFQTPATTGSRMREVVHGA